MVEHISLAHCPVVRSVLTERCHVQLQAAANGPADAPLVAAPEIPLRALGPVDDPRPGAVATLPAITIPMMGEALQLPALPLQRLTIPVPAMVCTTNFYLLFLHLLVSQSLLLRPFTALHTVCPVSLFQLSQSNCCD
jgi:hypothetical protein